MSHSNKKKQELNISIKEMAEKLRSLADELEKEVITINEEEFSLATDSLVKISLKAKDDKLSAKIKFKLATPFVAGEESPMEEGKSTEKYKDLKKRMSKDFKTIKKSCIENQTIPESDVIERFYQDSKTMCTYPNKGEEFYESYMIQVEFLNEAFKISDLKAMNTAIECLGRIRNDCHDKHK